MCPVTGTQVPCLVTLTQQTFSSSPVHLNVLNSLRKTPYLNLTVCVHSALFGPFPDPYMLIEFIEVYRILGADKFVIYNANSSAKIENIVSHYRDASLLDLFNWDLPSNMSTHYVAQPALIQDCIYRYMFASKYIALVNLDEFIFPRLQSSLLDLLAGLDCRNPGQIVFQSQFFSLDARQHLNGSAYKTLAMLNSLVLSYTMTDSKELGYRIRCKTIVNPRNILIGQVHTMRQMVPGSNTCRVPSAEAMIHHYRLWPMKQAALVEDTTARRFLLQIKTALLQAYRTLGLIT